MEIKFEPGSCGIVIGGGHAPVVDGGRVIKVGPGEVLVRGGRGHRGKAEVAELAFPLLRDQRDHTSTPKTKLKVKYRIENLKLNFFEIQTLIIFENKMSRFLKNLTSPNLAYPNLT